MVEQNQVLSYFTVFYLKNVNFTLKQVEIQKIIFFWKPYLELYEMCKIE